MPLLHPIAYTDYNKMIKATDSQLNLLDHARQTKTPKVLCVCAAGMLRSSTAANALHAEFGWNTRAAGSTEHFALIPASEALLLWADTIVFVHLNNYTEVMENNPDLKTQIQRKAVVLDIPDNYNWNAPGLKEEILRQMNSHYSYKEQS